MEITPTLTMGPLLFNWSEDAYRDFYFKTADESCVDTVYVGEVVCAKRVPFRQDLLPQIIERLEKGGKRVVLSTLALIMDKKDMAYVRAIAEMADDYSVEANDVAAISLLKHKPFISGPYINIYNSSSLNYMEKMGATRICLPVELNKTSIQKMKEAAKKAEIEVQIFGRLPLAIASRCYHARAHGKHKDNCQYVCEQDLDGMRVDTLDNQHFLAVNGTQTLSYTYRMFTEEAQELQAAGISHFRLSPHDTDMLEVARLYKELLNHKIDAAELAHNMKALMPEAQFSNGFYYGEEGIRSVA